MIDAVNPDTQGPLASAPDHDNPNLCKAPSKSTPSPVRSFATSRRQAIRDRFAFQGYCLCVGRSQSPTANFPRPQNDPVPTREIGRRCHNVDSLLVKARGKTRSSCISTRCGEHAAEMAAQHPVSSDFLLVKSHKSRHPRYV